MVLNRFFSPYNLVNILQHNHMFQLVEVVLQLILLAIHFLRQLTKYSIERFRYSFHWNHTSPENGVVITQERVSKLPDTLNFGTSIFYQKWIISKEQKTIEFDLHFDSIESIPMWFRNHLAQLMLFPQLVHVLDCIPHWIQFVCSYLSKEMFV